MFPRDHPAIEVLGLYPSTDFSRLESELTQQPANTTVLSGFSAHSLV